MCRIDHFLFFYFILILYLYSICIFIYCTGSLFEWVYRFEGWVKEKVESLKLSVKENELSLYLFAVPQGLMFLEQQKSSFYCSEEGTVMGWVDFLDLMKVLWVIGLSGQTTELLRTTRRFTKFMKFIANPNQTWESLMFANNFIQIDTNLSPSQDHEDRFILNISMRFHEISHLQMKQSPLRV